MNETASRYQRLHVSDPEGLTQAIRGSSLHPFFLGKKHGDSTLDRIYLPRIVADTVQLSPPLLVTGEMPVDCYTLVYVSECPSEGHSFNFSIQHRAGYMALFPPNGVLDAMMPAGFTSIALTIPQHLFLSEIESRFPEIPREWLTKGAALCIAEPDRQVLARLLSDRADSLARDTTWMTNAMACTHFENDLLDAFLHALQNSHQNQTQGTNSVYLRRCAAMRRMRDCIADYQDTPIHIDALCEASNMSRRGVEYVFRNLLGLSPGTFLRYHKLHHARQSLLVSERSVGLIKQVAYACGYWHLGRFSAEYQKLFGELPHETLKSCR